MTMREATDMIRNSISAVRAGEALGLRPNRVGFCCCPFHDDHDASLKLYSDDRGFFCFGCGKGGDTIRLVREVRNCSFREALEWLNKAFKLGIDIPTAGKNKQLESQRTMLSYEAFRRDISRSADLTLFEAYIMSQLLICELEEEKERYRPQFDEDWNERFCTALKLLPEARELADQLAVKVIGVRKHE